MDERLAEFMDTVDRMEFESRVGHVLDLRKLSAVIRRCMVGFNGNDGGLQRLVDIGVIQLTHDLSARIETVRDILRREENNTDFADDMYYRCMLWAERVTL
jgi:hypothetical protein